MRGADVSELPGEDDAASVHESPRRGSVLNRRVTLKLGRVSAFKNMKKRFLNKKLTLNSRTMEGESSSDLIAESDNH